MCISETYFDLPVLERDKGFQLNGYNLTKAYYSSNIKRGDVRFYYNEALCVCEVKLPKLSQRVIYEVFL